MLKLLNKIAIVTGSARGLGQSHALALAKEGAHVALIDILPSSACSTDDTQYMEGLDYVSEQIKALGRQALPITCDVRRESQVRDMVHSVISKWGKIDILINNAGVISLSSVASMKESEWSKVIDISLKGTFLCCKHVLKHMMNNRSGRIINTGSIAGVNPNPFNAHYGAAKAGVHLFTQALSKEVAPYGINVNAVAPGGVNTPMMKGLAPALAKLWGIAPELAYHTFCQRFNSSGREVSAQDVSNIVVWLASEETSNLTGEVVFIN